MSVECNQGRESRGEGTVRYQLEPDEPVSTAVVWAVARASGRSAVPDADASDPLAPLYEAIDPDALDALFATDRLEGCLTFTYCGHEVTVDDDGTITVVSR